MSNITIKSGIDIHYVMTQIVNCNDRDDAIICVINDKKIKRFDSVDSIPSNLIELNIKYYDDIDMFSFTFKTRIKGRLIKITSLSLH